MESKFVIGDLVTPATGPWHGLVGVVTEVNFEYSAWKQDTCEVLVEFQEPIENMNGLPCWDHYFEPGDLIKLDEAGKLLYVKE